MSSVKALLSEGTPKLTKAVLKAICGLKFMFISSFSRSRSAWASWAWALAPRFSFTCCVAVTLMSLAAHAIFWLAVLHVIATG